MSCGMISNPGVKDGRVINGGPPLREAFDELSTAIPPHAVTTTTAIGRKRLRQVLVGARALIMLHFSHR
jgi:hypothetical protein